MQYALANQNIATVANQIKLAQKIYDNTVLQNQQGMANITDLLLANNSLRRSTAKLHRYNGKSSKG